MSLGTNPAFDRYNEISQNVIDPLAVKKDNNTKHYLFYAGEHIPHPDIAGGFILRGQVTPVLPLPKWDRFTDIPDGMVRRTRGIVEAGGETHPEEGLYEIPPHPVFEDVMEKYGAWGVVEITALENMDVRDVAALNIDSTLFPNGVPLTYREQEEALRARMRELKGHILYETYDKVARAYMQSIERSRAYDMRLVDEVEYSIDSKEQGSLSGYTAPANRAMARLERPRRDKAIVEGMEQQKAIVNSLPELLARLAPPKSQEFTITPEQLTALREQVKAEILAEMTEPTTNDAATEATTPKPRRRPFQVD